MSPSTAKKSPLHLVLNFLGSLQLTVILLVLSIFLVFVGTLAQIDFGVWTVVHDYFRAWVAWVDLQLFFPRDRVVPGKFPIPGGWTLGGLLLVNLLVAHYQRFNLSKAKIGLFLIHAGLILLLVGEALTGIYAEEGNMTISEGSSSNYSEDIRHPELAIVTALNDKEDQVTVIPEAKLKHKGTIAHDLLPFDVQIDDYQINSVLQKEQVDGKSLWRAKSMPEVSGTETGEGRIDMPSVYVTLKPKNGEKALGAYLTSTWLNTPHKIEHEGKTYWLSLRFKRDYKPFSLHLIDFRFDRYMGTEIPKNFSSTVRLVDPDRGVEREVKIWMNNPLRYRGETFYQASYKPDESGTVLQVVKNPSWLIPYISCVVVTLGLFVQFGFSLSRSLKRRRRKMA